MLFFVKFEEMLPVLVDAENEDQAFEMASAVHDGEGPPVAAIPIPAGKFAAELFVPDPDDAELIIDVVPTTETSALLDALDETDVEIDGSGVVVCGEEGDYEGETVVCSKPPHSGEHEGTSSSGESVSW
jgi:hypothetical protein